jgi:hypothetical protein
MRMILNSNKMIVGQAAPVFNRAMCQKYRLPRDTNVRMIRAEARRRRGLSFTNRRHLGGICGRSPAGSFEPQREGYACHVSTLTLFPIFLCASASVLSQQCVAGGEAPQPGRGCDTVRQTLQLDGGLDYDS